MGTRFLVKVNLQGVDSYICRFSVLENPCEKPSSNYRVSPKSIRVWSSVPQKTTMKTIALSHYLLTYKLMLILVKNYQDRLSIKGVSSNNDSRALHFNRT